LSRAKLKHRASPLERTTPALKWKYWGISRQIQGR
jgi:hypothetical protein